MPARPEARPGRERALFGRFTHSRSAAGIADPAGASGRVEILRNPVRPAVRLVASALIRVAVARSRRTARHLQPASRPEGRSLSSEKERRMLKRLVIALAVVLSPAMLFAQKVSYDYEKSADFTAFKTYALKDGTKVGQPLIDDRIVAAIEQELSAKGLTKVDANPDVFVVYHTSFDKQKDISTFSSGYGGGYGPYGWGWGGGWAGGTTTTQVRDILMGTLVIDIADAKKKQLAWRGMGTKEVDMQAKPEKRDKSISSAVKKIFKNYPPNQS